MMEAKYLIQGIEIEVTGPKTPLDPAVYEDLGKILYNITELTPHSDLTRTSINVTDNNKIILDEISVRGRGNQKLLVVDSKEKKVELTGFTPYGYFALYGYAPCDYKDTSIRGFKQFETTVKKTFPGYKIEVW
jgi:hypothetical protein